MLFNSIEYLWFLPLVFITYWLIGLYINLKTQNLFLLVASYFFYGYWSIFFLVILCLSTLLDFLLAFGVNNTSKKIAKRYLIISIIANLGLLGLFKYYNFFVSEFASLLTTLGIKNSSLTLQFVVPVGISFYTFHGLSYVFDIYRKKQKPITNIIDYALFVSFFPLLVAGPIERASHLIPQIQQKRTFRFTQAREGCYLILLGLFKKIVIADSLATIVNTTYETHHNYTALSLILTAIAFSFQIYGDFSGYSDIAMGSSKLIGFEILSNFKFPYFSKNIREFWQRWHVSLSGWFRDYLYIPLGGSRGSRWMTFRNIAIIFIISGLWHGANWTFIIWGCIHALMYILYTFYQPKSSNNQSTILKLAKTIFTFGVVTFAWIFFRAKSIYEALSYLRSIVANIYDSPSKLFTGEGLANTQVIPYIIAMILIDWKLRKDERDVGIPLMKHISMLLLFLIIYKILTNKEAQFIYFQF